MQSSFLDFIDKTDKAASVEQLTSIFLNEVANLGYDRMAFCLLSDHNHIGLTAGIDFINNYPEDWLKFYGDNDFDKIDPVIAYCRQRLGTFTWEEMVQKMDMTRKQKTCLTLGTEAKLYNGVFTPVWGPHRLAGVALATSEKDDACDQSSRAMHLINAYGNHFYLEFQRLHSQVKLNNENLENVFLTPKEHDVLTWVARGKSTSVVSDLLKISEATVNFHIKNIFRKLNSNDRIVACSKAITLGLIHP